MTKAVAAGCYQERESPEFSCNKDRTQLVNGE